MAIERFMGLANEFLDCPENVICTSLSINRIKLGEFLNVQEGKEKGLLVRVPLDATQEEIQDVIFPNLIFYLPLINARVVC